MADRMMPVEQNRAGAGLRRGAITPRLPARVSVFCFLFSVLCPLNAEELKDPTRPPAMLAPSAPAAAPAAPVLQSVLIAPGRRAAIINGATIEMGGNYGGAKLIKVSEAEVVLKNADQVQILRLFPLVEKQTPAYGR